MAKTGLIDGDSTTTAKASDLKKELQRLVRAIVDNDNDEDSNSEAIDRATQTLRALKEAKSKKRVSLRNKRSQDFGGLLDCCPDEFRCPISNELMRDPVVVSTGQVRLLSLFQFVSFSWKCSAPWVSFVLLLFFQGVCVGRVV